MNGGTILSVSDESICHFPENFAAFAAFENQLKTLCLKEFPCGLGKWRAAGVKQSRHLKKNPTINRFSVTLKDYDAEKETTEALNELVTSKYSPWTVDYSWSEDAKTLRETAVISPEIVNSQFILNHFKTLKIVDKGVTEVDNAMSGFRNLESLNLSANFLKSVISRHLPKRLKILELFGNEIDDLHELCLEPLPHLLHLGLGHNNLRDTGHYVTGHYWSQLLSIDLGHNNLTNLVEVINGLETLPKLRNLILNGNPICLVPAYRVYTVNRLKMLSHLDDVPMSTDEKNLAQGLQDATGSSLSEAKILLKVPFMRGLPVPEEIQNPDQQPEFPQVSRKYFIQFMFLCEGKQERADLLQLPDFDQSIEKNDISPPSKENLLLDQADKKESSHPLKSFDSKSPPPYSAFHLQDKLDRREDSAALELMPISTHASEWEREIELNWMQAITNSNLLALRDFARTGMEFSIMEEKILSYPAPEPDERGTVSGSKGKKDKKAEKPKKSADKNDGKKKKKKGEPDIALDHGPPEYQAIASFHVPLDGFLEGEYEYERTYSQKTVAQSPSSSRSPSLERGSKKDKRVKEKGKLSADKTKDQTGKGKDSKEKKKSLKGKSGRGKDGILFDENEVPPPLEACVIVKLLHWRTAEDALKTDEDFLSC